MALQTFSISVLGCKVNQYEAEQIATLLRQRGLVRVEPEAADLRVVHTCAVTIQAASKSRQVARQLARPAPGSTSRPRVVITGCWATENRGAASLPAGIDAVLSHHVDLPQQLSRLLAAWARPDRLNPNTPEPPQQRVEDDECPPLPVLRERAGVRASPPLPEILPQPEEKTHTHGTRSLPLLDGRQSHIQRAFLKVQDGCDAHCTYCIIPQYRPRLWSKPIGDAVQEARRLVKAGHKELVLTGIFLGAYGQPTALRRRQRDRSRLAPLVDALCTQVTGLRRLRLSSLEPGDLTDELVSALRGHAQVVPHFHVPLQSGSATLLRRMNRQYTRDEFLRMIERLHAAFDRPALTTDIIVGFPGETDAEFERTLEVVEAARFIHIHAFPFSPRPGTAAARWTTDFVRGPVVNQRIDLLRQRASEHSLAFRRQFVGQRVTVMVERPAADEIDSAAGLQHGRCERYFAVHFHHPHPLTGELVTIRLNHVTPARTQGTLLQSKIQNPKSEI